MREYDLDPAVAAALSHVPRRQRPGLKTLFSLDRRLERIVASTTEPMIGQLRLAWWRDAVRGLNEFPAPAEPLLQLLQENLTGSGIDGEMLAPLTDGWEQLLVGPVTGEALDRFAEARGGTLFAAAGMLLGADHPSVRSAGEGWALARLPPETVASGDAMTLTQLTEARFADAFADWWPRAARPLGILALMTRCNLSTSSQRLRHSGAVLRFSLTGR